MQGFATVGTLLSRFSNFKKMSRTATQRLGDVAVHWGPANHIQEECKLHHFVRYFWKRL